MKRERVQISFEGSPGRTQQHFRNEADINFIMSKYSYSAMSEHHAQFKGLYGDFTDMPDYHTSLNNVQKAQDMFMSLPSSVRVKFDNDPSKFLEFVSDEKNRSEMKKMGLLKDSVVVDTHVSTDPVVDSAKQNSNKNSAE